MRKNYYTHDNGGRPFRVEVNQSENTITVFINYKFDKYKKLFNTKVFSSKYQEIWIGKSPKNENSPLSNSEYARRFDGNSILIKKSNNTYVFIGDNIFSFKSISPITKFVSPVEGSDGVYAYAIDIEGNIYLLYEEDNILIKPNSITLKTINKKYFQDYPYVFYMVIEFYRTIIDKSDIIKYLKKNNFKFEPELISMIMSLHTNEKKNKLTKTQWNKIFGLLQIPSKKEIVSRLE
jgi:hypothetical protein